MNCFSLTKQQEELWIAYKLNPKSENYNIAISYKLKGTLDQNKITFIYKTLGNYFEAFKTKFSEKDNKIKQKIYDNFDNDMLVIENFDNNEKEIFNRLEKERKKHFDLEKDYLFRGTLIKSNNDYHYIQFVWHHIISDGLTITIFSQLFEKLYNNEIAKIQEIKTFSIRHYLKYEEQIIKEKKEALIYWEKYLQGASQNDIIRYSNSEKKNINSKSIRIKNNTLNHFLEKNNIKPFIFFNAIVSLFIYRCFHIEDIVFSYPKNIRPREFNQIMGYFVSMFPLRVKLSKKMTFKNLLEAIDKDYKESKNYHKIPFEEIKKNLNLNYVPNLSVAETHLISPNIKLKNIKVNRRDFFYGGEVDKLSLIYDKKENIYEINSDTNFIPEYFINYFEQLFEGVLKNTDQSLLSYKLMSLKQENMVLYDWNKTEKDFPLHKTIDQLFEEQVNKTPNAIAVVSEETHLTYSELNKKANQLARYLKSIYQIRSGTLIGLCLDKSLEAIIGIFGIIKSGGAYVPIDPLYPDERIKYILDDTKAICILTQFHYVKKLEKLSNVPLMDLNSNYLPKTFSDTDLKNQNTPDSLVYVIYTSGTTGTPKGVCIAHKNLCNLVFSQKNYLDIQPSSNVLQFASLSFDASVWEIFSCLIFGSKLCIIEEVKKLDCKYFYEYVLKYKISHATLPPKFLSALKKVNDLPFLCLCSAGEKLDKTILKKWLGKYKFINGYGPTEATVCVTMQEYKLKMIPNIIGKPIYNTKCYVINNTFCPIGIVGELYVAGKGLAKGYLNQLEITNKKFIDSYIWNPEDKRDMYQKLYKTGDLVRWLPNGTMEYIDRKDTQTKINGFRIEISEIENIARNIKGIEDIVVIKKIFNNNEYLSLYYVSNNINIKSNDVLKILIQKLPNYMIPKTVKKIDHIPLSINGKVEINKLPNIYPKETESYIEPKTKNEHKICQIFAKVLGIQKVGIDDSFFDLGGSSIQAIMLLIELQKKFEININDIFFLKTPRKLAKNKKYKNDSLALKIKGLKKLKDIETVKLSIDDKLKYHRYLDAISIIKDKKYTNKPIKNVLLTGATGFFGCNLLNQLLISTSYFIYLPIRGVNRLNAMERMEYQYKFYFDHSLEEFHGDRVMYICCDIEKENLGLVDNEYRELISNIDSVIHCAALTKHYGTEYEFYMANVQATINLLKLCKLTRNKDFHYISTYSVILGNSKKNKELIFTEDDELDQKSNWDCPYNKTKFLGEIETIKWRKKGIKSNIYRIGNLAYIKKNGKIPEDISKNAFANYVKLILKLGCFPDVLNKIEISPADLVAKAVIKLFSKIELSNMTHHVFNPNFLTMDNLFYASNMSFSKCNINDFINLLLKCLDTQDDVDLIGHFLLRIGLHTSQENLLKNFQLQILQNRTEEILKNKDINFNWDVISSNDLKKYILKLNNTPILKAKKITRNYPYAL